MKEDKPKLLNVLWKYIVEYNWIVFIIFSFVMYLNQSNRQDYLEKQVMESRKDAIHRTETAFALGISGLKQTATVLETSLIEARTQNILLIEHCKKINCALPLELTTIKDMPKYTPISETYFGVQQIMLEKSKGE